MKFACKEIKLYEVLNCSFGLNKTSYKVFNKLIKKNSFLSIKQFANDCKLGSSSIQKALNSLVKKKLVIRKKINKKFGGYFFVYKINNIKEIKKELAMKLKKWFDGVKYEIEKL